jgi:3-dehydroquinate dehydratase-2
MADPDESREPIVLLLSGPNLSLLGEREPHFYGRLTLEEIVARAASVAAAAGARLEHLQSDREADLVAAVHGARHRTAAIVVNAAALSHYAWSLHDALAGYDGVVIEVHLSNVSAREPWRHLSVVTPVADGLVSGLGVLGYELAINAAIALHVERVSGGTA